MFRSTRFAAPLVVLMAFGPARSTGDDSEALLARFRSEGPPGWARLAEYENDLTYTANDVSTDTFFKDNRTAERKFMLTWVRRPGCLRLEKQTLDGKNEGRTTVSVYTERHMFQVCRPKAECPNWQLLNSGVIKQKTDTSYLLMGSMSLVFPVTSFAAGAFYRLIDLKGDSTITEGDSTVTFEKARVDDDGIRIDYRSAGKNLANLIFSVHGSIVLDPANNWAVRSYECINPDGLSVIVVNTFSDPDRDGVRRIASRRYHSVAAHGSVLQVTNYESIKTGPAPPEQFRLAAFGLPDPLGPLPSRFPMAYVLAAAAGICAFIAFWFRRRARQARLAVTPEAAT